MLSLVSTNSWNIDTSILDRKLRTEKNIVVVTDTHLNIVFATKNMWNMSQYRPDEIVEIDEIEDLWLFPYFYANCWESIEKNNFPNQLTLAI